MKYTDLTNKLIGNLWVKRPADIQELQKYVPQKLKWAQKPGYKTVVCTTNNRNKYWYCMCIKCGTYYVLRSDYILRKNCRCTRK